MRNVPNRIQHLNTWCHSLLFIVLLRTTAKSNLKRKGIIWFIYLETVNHWGKPRQKSKMDRNLEEPKQRSMKNVYWLYTHDLLSLLSYYHPGLSARGGAAPSGLCSPLSNINQENIPQVSVQANMQEAIPQLRSFSSQINIAYIKVTIKLTSMFDS